MTSMLERAESENDRVVLVGEAAAPGDEWTDFCVREADAVFALSRGAPSRAWLDRPDALSDASWWSSPEPSRRRSSPPCARGRCR